MAANTPKSKSIFTGTHFQAFYVIFMPYSRAPHIPFFKSANTSKFLDRFKNMCNNYRMSTSEKIYCLLGIVKFLPFGMSDP